MLVGWYGFVLRSITVAELSFMAAAASCSSSAAFLPASLSPDRFWSSSKVQVIPWDLASSVGFPSLSHRSSFPCGLSAFSNSTRKPASHGTAFSAAPANPAAQLAPAADPAASAALLATLIPLKALIASICIRMLLSFPAAAASLPISHTPKMVSNAPFTASLLSTIHCRLSLSFTRMSPMALVSGSSLALRFSPTSRRMCRQLRITSASFVKNSSTFARILSRAACFSLSSFAFM